MKWPPHPPGSPLTGILRHSRDPLIVTNAGFKAKGAYQIEFTVTCRDGFINVVHAHSHRQSCLLLSPKSLYQAYRSTKPYARMSTSSTSMPGVESKTSSGGSSVCLILSRGLCPSQCDPMLTSTPETRSPLRPRHSKQPPQRPLIISGGQRRTA